MVVFGVGLLTITVAVTESLTTRPLSNYTKQNGLQIPTGTRRCVKDYLQACGTGYLFDLSRLSGVN
jgi:hypothetical protein